MPRPRHCRFKSLIPEAGDSVDDSLVLPERVLNKSEM